MKAGGRRVVAAPLLVEGGAAFWYAHGFAE